MDRKLGKPEPAARRAMKVRQRCATNKPYSTRSVAAIVACKLQA